MSLIEGKVIDLKKGLYLGALSGTIWGLLVLIIVSITKVFEFDFSYLYNLPIFLVGGTCVGLIVGGFMEILKEKIPLRNNIQKAIVISLSLWGLFFLTGLMLHLTRPERYTIEIHQQVQGLVLSLVLGTILGILWQRARA